MEDKIYCGSGRVVSSKFGDITKISMHKDDINKIVKYMTENNSDWIKMELKEKKEKTEGKPTHYLQVDTWKPEPKSKAEMTHNTEPIIEDDLPF